MADKYRQIEEFVNLISPALKRLNKNGTLEIVDCGSGSSYLTFAIAAYCLEQNIDFHITGIETRADLTDKSEKLAKNLNLESKMSFAQKTIAQFAAERVLTAGSNLDLVVALHACDTATDEAIALGVGLGAKEIMVAPCCQHTLQKELTNNSSLAALGMFRSPGIIRERFLDLVTDQLRINVLRQFGYKADVVEFIPSEHTARNLLLRASRKSENLSSAATNSVGDDKADELFNDSMTPIKFEPPLLRIISEYFPNLKR
jgi:Methyltransferase domain